MLIRDITYFAPGVPFSELDLSGARMPDQILQRIEGYYLQPAEKCVDQGFAFAAGVLVVTCIDAMSRFAHGPNRQHRTTKSDFRGFVQTRLPSFKGHTNAVLFYDNYRNGLVHEARLKNGCQFSIGLSQTLDTTGRFPIVDAQQLLIEVRNAVHGLAQEMRDSPAFREQLVTYVKREFQFELGTALQSGRPIATPVAQSSE